MSVDSTHNPTPETGVYTHSVVAVVGVSDGVQRVGRGLASLGHRSRGTTTIRSLDGAGRAGAVGARAAVPGQSAPACGARLGGLKVGVALDSGLVSRPAIMRDLASRGALLPGSEAPDLLLGLMAGESQSTLVNRVIDASYHLRGGFTLAVTDGERLVAARDPAGLRPLWVGRCAQGWAVATESCALVAAGATSTREVEAGEVVVVDSTGLVTLRPFPDHEIRPCVLELLRCGRPDSLVADGSFATARLGIGAALVEGLGDDIDVVTALPADRLMGQGAAMALGRPYIDTWGAAGTWAAPELVQGKVVLLVAAQLGPGARAMARALAKVATAVDLRCALGPSIGPCGYGVQNPAPAGPDLPSNHAEDELRSLHWRGATVSSELVWGVGLTPCDACVGGTQPVKPGPQTSQNQVPLFRPK